MAIHRRHNPRAKSLISRRDFVRLAAGGLAGLIAHGSARSMSAAAYRVGVGNGTDAYAATKRAVAACGEWPGVAIAGRTVIIKPNLVTADDASTGTTTDPGVVHALTDLALADEASHVVIVESGPSGANFAACGYSFLDGYGGGKVALVDLNGEPSVLAGVPGMAYTAIRMPALLLADDIIFVSAAKLKTHFHTLATLSVKNLMGLPPVQHYALPTEEWRFAMHRRGISQAILDINLLRPIDFAVVDGIVGMGGNGPTTGHPVNLGLVLAGRNPVAVDRACLYAATLPQDGVLHLRYATQKGLGPASMAEIDLLGDSFTPMAFGSPGLLVPLLAYPQLVPPAFDPGAAQSTEITYRVDASCNTRVEIIQTSESSPEETLIRTLHDWMAHSPGEETVTWDGRDDDGKLVPPGRYTARTLARYGNFGAVAYATAWVWATEHIVYLPLLHKVAQ